VSGHSFAALGEVAEAIAADESPRGDAFRRHAVQTADRSAADSDDGGEHEPWASATPIPGSSVGMPSGHGPSRGNTTPGWVTDE
jgi:hypothetical protein